MNELDGMIETREANPATAIASKAAYVGVVALIVFVVAVFWFRSSR